MLQNIQSNLIELRKIKPVVLCLTNYVTTDFVANSLLALGASPIMSTDAREIEELLKISSALYINIGTLDDSFMARCFKAIELARHYNKPIILDPVGAGASKIRTQAGMDLLRLCSIVRGNASEIMALVDNSTKTMGVDAANQVSDAKDSARGLVKNFGLVTVVSGAVDFITNGNQETELLFGSSIMPSVTGMGCALTAIIAAFRGVMQDSYSAAAAATAYFGLCGNLAEIKAKKPGTFRTVFIDKLFAANFIEMQHIILE